MHQLQLAISEKFFGRKWWDQRRLDFKMARELLQKKENLINKVSQDSQSLGTINLARTHTYVGIFTRLGHQHAVSTINTISHS